MNIVSSEEIRLDEDRHDVHYLRDTVLPAYTERSTTFEDTEVTFEHRTVTFYASSDRKIEVDRGFCEIVVDGQQPEVLGRLKPHTVEKGSDYYFKALGRGPCTIVETRQSTQEL